MSLAKLYATSALLKTHITKRYKIINSDGFAQNFGAEFYYFY